MYYLDTSVLAAYYCPEPLSDKVEKLIISTDRLSISSLTEVELASAISRKIREKNLFPEDGNKIFNQFQIHLKDSFYWLLSIEDRHYQAAKNWILQFALPLKTLDALHLAIAAEGGFTLLTSDRQLYISAKYFGIDAVDVSIIKL
jgi:predicted nucleic acid-binding protein